jgi:hypothetical protein
VKLPKSLETEVYTNVHGDLVIRQSDFPEDDIVVILPQFYALKVAAEIYRLSECGDLHEHTPDADEDPTLSVMSSSEVAFNA